MAADSEHLGCVLGDRYFQCKAVIRIPSPCPLGEVRFSLFLTTLSGLFVPESLGPVGVV